MSPFLFNEFFITPAKVERASKEKSRYTVQNEVRSP